MRGYGHGGPWGSGDRAADGGARAACRRGGLALSCGSNDCGQSGHGRDREGAPREPDGLAVASDLLKAIRFLSAASEALGETTGMYLKDSEGTMKTSEVTATFTNGKPRIVKGVMVLPGGAGSAQETLAMLQLRKAEPVFKDVPLVLINADGVWDGLAKAAKAYGLEEGKDFHVYPDVKSAMPFLDKAVAALDARPDWPVSDIDQAAKKLGGWRSDRRPAAGPASDIDAPAAKPGDQPAP